ncbi:MAG TPA: GldG family protein [Methylococcaceae bacterium]|nr:GldG family protein [Methylococcaceae bacterium]
MKIDQKIHTQIRLQNLLFTVLFLGAVGLAGWLSTRYSAQFDWTASGRNTLSEASVKVLELVKEPVSITSYARENNKTLREQIGDLVARYSRVNTNVSLSFVNPDTQPDKTREMGVSLDGEMVVATQGRSEKVQEFTESALTNALQRLLQARDQNLVFLEGHGERSPLGQANFDLGQFGAELQRKGVHAVQLNLAKTPDIPANTNALVVAGPQTNLLPGEVALIQDYVKKGGNLLWLAEPGDLHGLQPLGEQLGVKFLPGTVVDASTQMLGINDPTFALVVEYPYHPVTRDFQSMTLFPVASALETAKDGELRYTALLRTLARSWTETGPVEGEIRFNADSGEKEGPLTLGVAVTRAIEPEAAAPDKKPTEQEAESKPREQRIVIVGDGDFLSNTYLGNGGNLNLGLNLVQWLGHNDAFINIPAKTSGDVTLALSQAATGLIGVGFLLLLPALLIGTGGWIWFRRRGR